MYFYLYDQQNSPKIKASQKLCHAVVLFTFKDLRKLDTLLFQMLIINQGIISKTQLLF